MKTKNYAKTSKIVVESTSFGTDEFNKFTVSVKSQREGA